RFGDLRPLAMGVICIGDQNAVPIGLAGQIAVRVISEVAGGAGGGGGGGAIDDSQLGQTLKRRDEVFVALVGGTEDGAALVAAVAGFGGSRAAGMVAGWRAPCGVIRPSGEAIAGLV